jgi:hypothetical protein
MKTLLLALVTILSIGTTTIAWPNRPETFKRETFALRYGNQKTVARGELRIRFVTVMEDSRCPVGVNCVWAGNAKIQVKVSDRRGRSKVMELNTSGEPRGAQFGRYAINLVNLTPQPRENNKPSPSRYTAMFSIQR